MTSAESTDTGSATDPAIIRPWDVLPEPWVNGLGETRVLAVLPSWRISIAEIEGRARFSAYPEMDRLLIPLDGAGVTLEIEGHQQHVGQYAAITFRGEDRVVAVAAEPRVRVVNVMTRRSDVRADWVIRNGANSVAPDVDAIVVLGGESSIRSLALPPGTLIKEAGCWRDISGKENAMLLLVRFSDGHDTA